MERELLQKEWPMGENASQHKNFFLNRIKLNENWNDLIFLGRMQSYFLQYDSEETKTHCINILTDHDGYVHGLKQTDWRKLFA